MATAPQPQQQDRASDAEMREVLAFELGLKDGQRQFPTLTRAVFADHWRAEEAVRQKARALSDELMQQCREVGLKISVASSAIVRRKLDEIMTVPPRLAYALDAARNDQTTP